MKFDMFLSRHDREILDLIVQGISVKVMNAFRLEKSSLKNTLFGNPDVLSNGDSRIPKGASDADELGSIASPAFDGYDTASTPLSDFRRKRISVKQPPEIVFVAPTA